MERKGEKMTNSDPDCSPNFTAQRSCERLSSLLQLPIQNSDMEPQFNSRLVGVIE